MRISLILIFGLTLACGKKKAEETGFSVFTFNATTIVNEATPTNLRTSSAGVVLNPGTAIEQIKDRMYTSMASSTIPNIIKAFDESVAAINARASGMESAPACMTSEPQSRTILTPDDQPFPVYFQCYDQYSASAFMVWGVDTDKNIYIFDRNSAMVSLAKLTPQDGGKYKLLAYLSSNYLDGTNSSGTIVKILADQTAATVQASTAAPHEVCGASIYADSSKIHLRGSISLTTANACPAETDAVYSAIDLSETTGFDASLLFATSQSFRRKAGTKLVNSVATTYEEYANTSGQGNVTLDQVTNPASGGTDINFGPSTADELGGTAFR